MKYQAKFIKARFMDKAKASEVLSESRVYSVNTDLDADHGGIGRAG